MNRNFAIERLSVEEWRNIVSLSNLRAMKKRHKYSCYEGAFLAECYIFQKSDCEPPCFCKKVGCNGVWVLRPQLEFSTFLYHFAMLWDRGQFESLMRKVTDLGFPATGRSKNAIQILRGIEVRWSNWDGNGNSLPSIISKIRRCYFCDDAFKQITPHVRTILSAAPAPDSTNVFTSKLVSQLFYDIAVPFDTMSQKRQKQCGYVPEDLGDGKMRAESRKWLLANKMGIDEFRTLDNAPTSCWLNRNCDPYMNIGTACSRVLDKLFYE